MGSGGACWRRAAATCATAGVLGDQLPGAPLTWSPVPSGLSSAAAVVTTSTPGVNGLFMGDRLRYTGTQPVPQLTRPGQLYVLALSYEARRVISNAAQPDTSLPYLGASGGAYLQDDGTVPSIVTPLVSFADP